MTELPAGRRPAVCGAEIAVTGLGVVSPIGVGQERFWAALCGGVSGVRPQPEATDLPHIAASLVDYLPRDLITTAHVRRMDDLSRAVVSSARLALADAGVDDVAGDGTGVVVGTAFGNVRESVQFIERAFNKGPALASPMLFPNLVHNAAASYVAMELGSLGVNLTVSDGEVSGEQALGLAAQVIRGGQAECAVAGGGDQIADIVAHAYRRLRALSSQRGGDEWCSPFDVQRNGVVVGEGAAMILLEPSARAQRRGAKIYALLEAETSFAIDAPLHDWPWRAPRAAARLQEWLRRVLPPAATVDAVFTNANSTRNLDACLVDVLARVFGENTPRVALTSIKGAIGEFGAAGALTAVAAALALHHQTMPPLCHLQQAAKDNPFQLIASRGAARSLQRVLVFSMARGGLCTALLLRHGA